MVLDTILKLIDRCIELLKLRQDKKRNLLVEHIAPIYSDFEALHKNYLQCFETYRELLKSERNLDSSHPIFDQIVKDHVFTQGLRNKLQALGSAIPENSATYHVDSFDMFMWHVQHYFIWAESHVFRDGDLGFRSNDPRSCLIFGLRFIVQLTPSMTAHAVDQLNRESCIWFVDQFALPFFNSEGRHSHLLMELNNANGHLPLLKRALAVALVDSIMEQNQWSYRQATEEYLKLRNALL